MSSDKIDLRAAEYRARAEAASAAARASSLDRQREQQELAAARWTDLAVAEERRAAERRAIEARVEADARAAAPQPEPAQ